MPLLLYSTNTWLSYQIAQRFYGQVHYVWCTPYFDMQHGSGSSYGVAPTSAPMEIYRNLSAEVRMGDTHSSKIAENKSGISRGAAAKLSAGVITSAQQVEIEAIVTRSPVQDFRPLLFVIPYDKVASLVVPVAVEQRAHPLSGEYVITELPRSHFDVLEFRT